MGNIVKIRQELIKASVDLMEREQELCLLDSYVGDGDHGTTVKKSFEIVKQIAEEHSDHISELFQNCATGIMDRSGGAIGPILSAFFLGLAEGSEGKEELEGKEWAPLFAAALRSVTEVGGARPGDRTLVDTLTAVDQAFQEYKDASCQELWEKVIAYAYRGAMATGNMRARKGRAKFLGEQSTGYVDAGAMTMYYFIRTIAEEEKIQQENTNRE